MTRHLSFASLCTLATLLIAGSSAMAQQNLSDVFPGQGGFGAAGGGFGGLPTDEPVTVEAKLIPVDAQTVDLSVTVNIALGHYIYSTKKLEGSTPTEVKFDRQGFEPVGNVIASHAPEVKTEYGFTLEKYYDSVTWKQRLRSTSGALSNGVKIQGRLTGQACTSSQCLPIDPPIEFTAQLPEDFDLAKLPAASRSKPAAPGKNPAVARNSVQVITPDFGDDKGSPVRFTVSISPSHPKAGAHVLLSVKAELEESWHIYSQTMSEDAIGIPTTIKMKSTMHAEPSSSTFVPSKKPTIKQPKGIPGPPQEYFSSEVEWQREFAVTSPDAVFEGEVTYQICTATGCKSPSTFQFRVATETANIDPLNATSVIADAMDSGDGKKSWLPFILAAMGAGFVALLTPCVFPMIPVTVSYFIKQGETNPGSTLRLAVIYCLGIVSAFTVLGLAVAVAFGGSALTAIANNPWLNLFFAAVFTAFALMLLGMFELQVPSWLLTWSSKKQESGGVIGVLFMALTFTLVSFTCTFAFVGNVLVLAANGESYLRPIIGMAAFSLAFASPFFLLALFPSFLKKLPKSGGWMNRVKVTLGLLELAIVVKFLSIADIGFSPNSLPRFIDYHLAMGIWMAIAVVTGLYLLHVFRTAHDTPSESVPAIQCFIATGFLCVATYIAVGMFSAKAPKGALWQTIVAFAPPQLNVDGLFIEHDGLRYSLDFDATVSKTEDADQPLFVDFTGVNCVNCRKMENTVLKEQDVHSKLESFIKVAAYMDEVPGVKSEELSERILSRNKVLQSQWLKDTSLPTYVIATPDGKDILAVHAGYDESGGDKFRQFLKTGLQRWEQRKGGSSDQALVNRVTARH